MSYDPAQVAFVDIETTGLDPEFHHVWEIAVIVDGVEHCWQQYFGGWGLVDPWVLENTGIRERFDPDSALPPTDSMDRFLELVKGRHLIGACPWFDSERLHAQQRHYTTTFRPEPDVHGIGVPFGWGRDLLWHYHLIDVETLAVGWLARIAQSEHELVFDAKGIAIGTRVSWNGDIDMPLPWDSNELSKLAGVDPDLFMPKHRALTDARWAKAIFDKIMGPARPR